MARKKSLSVASEDSFGEADRQAVLDFVYDKVEIEPPVGKRYEILLRDIIRSGVEDRALNLSKGTKESVINELFAYVASYGPIEPLLREPRISEIMVNGPDQVFVERDGQITLTSVKFDSVEQVRFAINHMINPTGRFINSKHAMIDSRLPDGSRVNAVIMPVTPNWPAITIRRFLKDKLTVDQLIRLGSFSPNIAEFLAICVKARLNIIVAGNTSSGKTTLLNILAQHIPDWERIITIEDSAELNLHQIHKVSLEAQPPDYRGEGAVTIRDLVRNALRMRPDRLIIGEVRGGEALDMLQAMNTGHAGSMTTIHSNSARDTISRLETMALIEGIEIPVIAIRKQIASAINLVIYLSRLPDGSRKLTQISEIAGMEHDVVTMTDLFVFQQTGFDAMRRVKGIFKSTGLRPSFSPMLEAAGLHMDARWFMD